MNKLDLSASFINLLSQRQRENPELRLENTLAKAMAPLKSYAQSLNIDVDGLTLFHICTNDGTLHPYLMKHIDQLPITDLYKSQHRSRIRKIIRSILLVSEGDVEDPSIHVMIEDQLPEHLRQVWPLLNRMKCIIPNGKAGQEGDEAYLMCRSTAPLSASGLSICAALLSVSNEFNISDIQDLLESHGHRIIDALHRSNSVAQWHKSEDDFYKFRRRIQEFLKYEVKPRTRVSLEKDTLPEPLRTQVQVYEERGRHGFKSDPKVRILARTRYHLELGQHSVVTIRNYLEALYIGLGHIPRELYGESLDVRDLLKLEARQIEVEGMTVTELYNPLVEFYRKRELARYSEVKEEGFDSSTFQMFVCAITAIAAFNGYLHLRKLFLKEYQITLDVTSKERRKQYKKQVFDRPWLERQIQRLRLKFQSITADGDFTADTGGTLNRDRRYNLNLCLFYITLVTLRYLGVRQQCVRDCLLDKNISFDKNGSITFQWTDEEIKNGQGICHRLSLKEHAETHALLIEALWLYNKKIYPYLSGSSGNNQPLHVREERRRLVKRQFFLKCKKSGLCAPFTSESDFGSWFEKKSKVYLDFEGRLEGKVKTFNPHFLRGLYGDWLRFDLYFSSSQTALLAGDTEQTFESEYITHPSIYDATKVWTEKNIEIKNKKDSRQGLVKTELPDKAIRRVESKVEVITQSLKKISDKMDQLNTNTQDREEAES